MANPKPSAHALVGDDYILNRSHLAACRLNLQHFLWRESLNFTLSPSIPISNPSPTIADVCCGTALWLFDAATQYPTAQLHGFDIDLSQAPHEAWLPHNIRLHQWDIFDDVDPAWMAKFDVVHIRLLVLVLAPEKVQRFARNVARMLKPGGWLQWDELDCVGMHVKKSHPDIAAPALQEIYEMSYAQGRYNWTLDIPVRLSAERFESVVLTKYGDEARLSRAFHDQHLFTMEEIAGGMRRAGKAHVAARLEQLIEEAHAECVSGAALCIPRVVCVAQRPGADED
jgi:SAM-dependent methyltransferase